jgi:hypothetical protein
MEAVLLAKQPALLSEKSPRLDLQPPNCSFLLSKPYQMVEADRMLQVLSFASKRQDQSVSLVLCNTIECP